MPVRLCLRKKENGGREGGEKEKEGKRERKKNIIKKTKGKGY
jgi:hypothetical protein